MKDKPAQDFRSAFQQFLKEENLEQPYHEKRLVLTWEELMGKPIASRTEQLYIRNRILFVKLASAPLKQDLINKRETVLKTLVERMGVSVVDEIRFL